MPDSTDPPFGSVWLYDGALVLVVAPDPGRARVGGQMCLFLGRPNVGVGTWWVQRAAAGEDILSPFAAFPGSVEEAWVDKNWERVL
jgi:hypothetical protein